MKIPVAVNINPDLVMRRSGYGFLRDRQHGTESYVRRLGSGFYPRFHVYVQNNSINLHLDQKQASYGGTSAHSGEYDGEVVEREGERIKVVMSGLDTSENPPKAEEKKGFWQSILG